MKEISCFIEKREQSISTSKIPKNIIQTYKNNQIHDTIYDNIMAMMDMNRDYNYYLITDEIGIFLLEKYFNEFFLNAFKKLNLGAAKGDFLRYIALYIYGGVYVDMDSSICTSLSSFVNPDTEHVFFLDENCNLQQWCFMVAPQHPIIHRLIDEMVRRIIQDEKNIFLATGPTLFTDVVYNLITGEELYNITYFLTHQERFYTFIKNKNFMGGMIIYELDEAIDFKNKFIVQIENYTFDMLYKPGERYIEIFNVPTPNFYKEV
jgi:mannosyltransferase OCH1-like enzyme